MTNFRKKGQKWPFSPKESHFEKSTPVYWFFKKPFSKMKIFEKTQKFWVRSLDQGPISPLLHQKLAQTWPGPSKKTSWKRAWNPHRKPFSGPLRHGISAPKIFKILILKIFEKFSKIRKNFSKFWRSKFRNFFRKSRCPSTKSKKQCFRLCRKLANFRLFSKVENLLIFATKIKDFCGVSRLWILPPRGNYENWPFS